MNTLRGLKFVSKVANPAKIQVVGDATVQTSLPVDTLRRRISFARKVASQLAILGLDKSNHSEPLLVERVLVKLDKSVVGRCLPWLRRHARAPLLGKHLIELPEQNGSILLPRGLLSSNCHTSVNSIYGFANVAEDLLDATNSRLAEDLSKLCAATRLDIIKLRVVD